MKKIILIVSLFFTINLSAAEYIGNVDVSTSGCVNYKWDRYTQPQANICYDIYGIQAEYIDYYGTKYYNSGEIVKGFTSSTTYNHEGSWMYIAVDVFGVPTNQPNVTYKYKTLSAPYYENIVNNGIVNGTRYWFLYQGDSNWGNVESGNIIVKEYATEKDSLYIN
ncbi:MAG: hypothetical protein PHF17_02750 [Arcobacteraceae bacterium]|nr:hypothetical protein [Arcobacteraceae bacterium]